MNKHALLLKQMTRTGATMEAGCVAKRVASVVVEASKEVYYNDFSKLINRLAKRVAEIKEFTGNNYFKYGKIYPNGWAMPSNTVGFFPGMAYSTREMFGDKQLPAIMENYAFGTAGAEYIEDRLGKRVEFPISFPPFSNKIPVIWMIDPNDGNQIIGIPGRYKPNQFSNYKDWFNFSEILGFGTPFEAEAGSCRTDFLFSSTSRSIKTTLRDSSVSLLDGSRPEFVQCIINLAMGNQEQKTAEEVPVDFVNEVMMIWNEISPRMATRIYRDVQTHLMKHIPKI